MDKLEQSQRLIRNIKSHTQHQVLFTTSGSIRNTKTYTQHQVSYATSSLLPFKTRLVDISKRPGLGYRFYYIAYSINVRSDI